LKVLFDINHPAHVHFFKNTFFRLKALGHEVLVTSRKKECALELLDSLQVEHHTLSGESGSGLISLAKELVYRDWKLFQVVKQERPDIMASIGGTFIAHVGLMSGIPSLVFYDTENAKLQNLITYPFARKVIVPRCYNSWTPRKKTVRYSGYHELAYLHPDYFQPCFDTATKNGLAPSTDNFLIRVVAWNANHDIGEEHWTTELLSKIVAYLSELGQVIISSECELPEQFDDLRYKGKVSQMHHVIAYCRAYIGESATMASEAAVLGVPALYVAKTGRGYTAEQERLYGLVKNVVDLDWPVVKNVIDTVLDSDSEYYQQKKLSMLSDTIDVTEFLTDLINDYSHSD
jgi:predicted glycosyltransferase